MGVRECGVYVGVKGHCMRVYDAACTAVHWEFVSCGSKVEGERGLIYV